jgi:hypothetical protein
VTFKKEKKGAKLALIKFKSDRISLLMPITVGSDQVITFIFFAKELTPLMTT